MVNAINIKNLNLEELIGVVGIYPWYGAARRELCARMTGTGAWTTKEYSETALYVCSRSIISELAKAGRQVDCSDKDLGELMRKYIEAGTAAAEQPESEETIEAKELPAAEQPERRFVVIGGDYFSQAEYNDVRRPDDNMFSQFAVKGKEDGYAEENHDVDPIDFCTETLAQIYLEQDYPEQAKEIYSKLILRYPEKSVYFASLIEKIDNQK